MNDIKFYIPKGKTIPTDLRLFVDNNPVEYVRISGGFRFCTLLDDEKQALKLVKLIVDKIKYEYDEPEHGVTWVTTSFEVVPQNELYKIGTIIDWKYRVRDSY